MIHRFEEILDNADGECVGPVSLWSPWHQGRAQTWEDAEALRLAQGVLSCALADDLSHLQPASHTFFEHWFETLQTAVDFSTDPSGLPVLQTAEVPRRGTALAHVERGATAPLANPPTETLQRVVRGQRRQDRTK